MKGKTFEKARFSFRAGEGKSSCEEMGTTFDVVPIYFCVFYTQPKK